MIIAIGMVKNEEDILEAFVRHTLHYVDHLQLIENGSQDATLEILQRLQAEGLPLDVIVDPTFKYNQGYRITALYGKVLLKHKPRFVIPLDADEFIQAPSKAAFDAALERIPPNGMGVWPWRTCLPSNPKELLIRDRFALARKHESKQHGKIILRAPANGIDPRLEITQGSHNAIRSRRPLPSIIFDDMHLAHLPVRSIRQLTQKVILGWMANVSQFKTTDPACGFHWGELYRRALELTPEDLVREAYNYSEKNRSIYMDCMNSDLRIEGLTTRLSCDAKDELDLKALLAFVCRNWEASLLV
jgi:glycosyltransferase involved in cell wall biosynthesis